MKDANQTVAQDAEIIDDAPSSSVVDTQALTLAQKSGDALILRRKPREVLAEAHEAAAALMSVMNTKPNKVMMGNEQYIENEDWQTIGNFYGATAQIEHDEYVEYGDAQGWEATAILVARDGRILGRATAMCLNDEEKWSERPKKAWTYCLGTDENHALHQHSVEDPGKDRIIWEDNPNKPDKKRPRKFQTIIGSEKVPTFQLRSMAQTRASSKVHRMVLGFVPVLAGYNATPAEELPDAERVPNDPKASATATTAPQTTQAAPPPQQTQSAPTNGNGGKATKLVTDNQVRRLWAIVSKSSVAEDDVVKRVREHYGCSSTTDLTMAQYDELVAWVEGGGK